MKTEDFGLNTKIGDKIGENKNVAPIKNKNIINKGNNTNLSTVVSTNNTNANLITKSQAS